MDNMRVGEVPPFLHAQHARFGALLAALSGRHDEAETGFKNAAGTLREINAPFHLAVVLLDQGEFLISHGRAGEAEPLLSEAKEVFVGLKARPWLERAEKATSMEAVTS
jgi:hypothetical protein